MPEELDSEDGAAGAELWEAGGEDELEEPPPQPASAIASRTMAPARSRETRCLFTVAVTLSPFLELG
jgi:hypothetical protein